jgi:hypothetical protein
MALSSTRRDDDVAPLRFPSNCRTREPFHPALGHNRQTSRPAIHGLHHSRSEALVFERIGHSRFYEDAPRFNAKLAAFEGGAGKTD